MNWKSDLKLRDLDATTQFEITCRRCGHSRCEDVATIQRALPFRDNYLDEVEMALCCSLRSCKGGVRIALLHDGKNEGFVGGMA